MESLGCQTERAASRVRRERACWSAPALSSAPVASARRRPVRPRCGRTEIDAWTSDAGGRGSEPVVDVEADRAGGGQGEPVDVGRVDLHVEADAAAGQAAGDPRAARRRPGGGRPPRRTARAPSGKRRPGRSARAGRPRGAPRRWRWRSRSSWSGTVPPARRAVVGRNADLTARQDDPPSSSRMTPGSFLRTTRYGYPHVTLPGMPAALRTRLPALIAAAVAGRVPRRARGARAGRRAAPRARRRCCWPRSPAGWRSAGARRWSA